MTTSNLHTTAEAAVILRVSKSFLNKASAARTLPHTRIGRKVLWSDKDIAAIIEAGQTAPVPPPSWRGRRS
jgi:excisionase family DNA binding protein